MVLLALRQQAVPASGERLLLASGSLSFCPAPRLMPDSPLTPKGAVFLSYASQDAEAARRICEALRGAGVEVWFDQSELRGGDAWDQSIRKQIKQCALFMPVISAHTQERAEGYFRLEWHLAEQRSHLIARGRPFIVPVNVDGTNDHGALVPDAFLAVQWSNLPGGETPTAFCERVKTLLAGPTSETGHPVPASAGYSLPRHAKASRTWMLPAIAGVIMCLVLAVWQPWRSAEKPSQAPQAAASPPESQQLVAKAWAQLNKPELGPQELEIADGFCKRATELDPTNADAWAAWANVNSWYIYHNFDSSKARQDAARSCAARALELAPASYEARLAQACYLVRGSTVGTGHGEVSTFAPEANRLLSQLLAERKDEPRALFALAILQRNLGNEDEAVAEFTRLTKNPQFSASAWCEIAWIEYFAGSLSAVQAPLARSIAIQPFWGNLGLKITIALIWYGDLASARAAMDELPSEVMQSDFGASIALSVFSYQRKPDEWLRFSRGIRRDWIQSNGRTGPIAAYNGLAQKMAGRNDAARIEWEAALKLVERGLADQPADAGLLEWKAQLLAYLGDFAEAEKALHQAEELSGKQLDRLELNLEIAEGHVEAAVETMDSQYYYTAAELRFDPDFDPLRNIPRFKSLLARTEADPKKSPQGQKN
jgi:tetratricopeptide (TPR) repeat protein